MSALIAVSGATVSVSEGATGTIASPPSIKVNVNGAGAYRGALTINLLGGQLATCVGVSGTGSIAPTAIKVTADGQPVIREGDTGTGTITGTDSGTGSPCAFPVTIEVDNAGQDKVNAI